AASITGPLSKPSPPRSRKRLPVLGCPGTGVATGAHAHTAAPVRIAKVRRLRLHCGTCNQHQQTD
ncbi:MAG: hypothetical protein ACK412_09775, partial [Chloroherpetonaceae bacterium]